MRKQGPIATGVSYCEGRRPYRDTERPRGMGPAFAGTTVEGSSGPHPQIAIGGALQFQPRLFQIALQCLLQENRAEPSSEAVCRLPSSRYPLHSNAPPEALC